MFSSRRRRFACFGGAHTSKYGGAIDSWRFVFLSLILLLLLCAARPSLAQLPPPGTASQFDIVGFLQEATLNNPQAGATGGGQLKVNGHVVTVPDNTIVILPANALTWQELFAQAPPPYGPGATGMALADSPAPLTTYEVHVIGNRVGDTYIAGMIYLSQQELNAGAGYINFIDYARGEIYVGGKIIFGSTGLPSNSLSTANPGTRISINDPTGKFGRVASPDPRFTLDPENPTIRSATGFPMCLPRTDPATTEDALCPQGNRPKNVTGNFVTSFDMPDPATLAVGQLPDPRIMAPLEVGDYVDYAGILVSGGGTAGPYPLASGATTVAAHTITDNAAIYTSPGKNPAYIAVEVALIGTGGLTVAGAGEAVLRTRFEGMTTDPSRLVHLYGIDFDASGKPSDRDFGTIGADPGPPTGAVKGRWRFRPPCTAATPTAKDCTAAAAGTFLPPPREVRAVIQGAWTPATAAAATGGANGLIAGQYHAPILEYIFPENVPGTPPPPNNFETIPFLALGGYSSSTGVLAGQLAPWPGKQAPGLCAGPVASAGSAFSVASGAKGVPLSGSASGTAPLTYLWTTTAKQNNVPVIINNPTSLNPSFDALTVTNLNSQDMEFLLTVSGCNQLQASATVVVTVEPAPPTPLLNPIAPRTIVSGTPVTLTANGTVPPSYTYVWKQVAGPSQPFVQTAAAIKFTRTIPVGQLTNDVLAFSATAVDAPPSVLTSNTITATVTVVPTPDVDTITAAVFRTSKLRLELSAASSIVNPNLTLTLQPYRTILGTIFDPTGLGSEFTNTGNGTYTLSLVGAPQPAAGPSLVVKSNIGGQSPPTALTLVRN
jgi:hypothetical protein